MYARDLPVYLSQRAKKTFEIRPPPATRVAQLTTIEVEQPGFVVCIDQKIVRSQIGMKHACIVELSDAASDPDPRRFA
jgi:hypothetical protein